MRRKPNGCVSVGPVALAAAGVIAVLFACGVAHCEEPASADAKKKEAAIRPGEENLKLAEKDGKLIGSFTYRLTVGNFYEWNTDPTAIPGILRELAARTGIDARVEFKAVGLDDAGLFRNPLLMMTGNRMFRLSPEEIKNLGRYLTSGGFLYVDDCGGADWSLRRMMKNVLPDAKLVEIGTDHPLFSQLYNLKDVPKVVDLYHGPAKVFGMTVGDNRLAVVYTYDTDMPCAWERYPDGSYVHVIEAKKRESAMRFGVNVLLFALRQHLGKAERPAEAAEKSSLPEPATLPPDALRNYPMVRQLPTNYISAMASDERYVWFGGFSFLPGEDEGLGRYDKTTGLWRIFMDAEGVLTEEINDLAVKDGKVLIGADTWKWTRGMATFDPATGKWSVISTKDGLPHQRVRAIRQDGGDLWIACRQGLGFLAAGSKRVESITSPAFGDEGLYMIDVMVDERYVWANHFGGVARFDKQEKKWEAVNKLTPLIPAYVKGMARTPKAAWFLSPVPKNVRLVRFDYEKKKFEEWKPATEFNIAGAFSLAAYEDEIWIGTRGRGIYVFKTGGGGDPVMYSASDVLPKGDVKEILPEKKHVWATILPYSGLWRLDRGSDKWEHIRYREGTPATHIHSLAKVDDALYVGTLGGGLWLYQPQRDQWQNLNLRLVRQGRFYAYYGDSSAIKWNNIYAMAMEGEKIWMATNHGLIVHEMSRTPQGFEIVGPVGLVCNGLALADGLVWVGGAEGQILAYDPEKKEWPEEKAWSVPAPVRTLAVWNGSLYAATEKGLYRRGTGAEKAAELVVGPGDAYGLWPLQSALWFATGRGLHTLADPKAEAKLVAGSGEWGKIYCLVRRGNALLVGTDRGLFVCTPKGVIKAFYNMKSGLGANGVASIAAGDEYVWLGTLGSGIARIKASSLGIGRD
ncbi:MAG: DUF4159 domain-containing protein [Phycisphaerae bacterium]|nr:DUF4159 domain-containing protein [Phycisphaerae bacterium]